MKKIKPTITDEAITILRKKLSEYVKDILTQIIKKEPVLEDYKKVDLGFVRNIPEVMLLKFRDVPYGQIHVEIKTEETPTIKIEFIPNQNFYSTQKILFLSLKKSPFEVMHTGEKTDEFREPTKWIKSRLLTANGEHKIFDYVKFTNGYGKDKPFFICKYEGFELLKLNTIHAYSNNLVIDNKEGDIKIRLGRIIQKGNIKKTLDK